MDVSTPLKPFNCQGGPIVPEIADEFPNGKLRTPIPLLEYEDVVVRMKNFRERCEGY